MKKNIFGRRLKRDKNQRKALFKSLMSSLVLEERIKTTEEKAKSIKGQIEKLVTKVKKKGVLARNQLQDYLVPKAIDKFLTDTALRFSKRNGGYTRLIRFGTRFDSSSIVLMEWVEAPIQISNIKYQKEEKHKEEDQAKEKSKDKKVTREKKSRKKATKKKE